MFLSVLLLLSIVSNSAFASHSDSDNSAELTLLEFSHNLTGGYHFLRFESDASYKISIQSQNGQLVAESTITPDDPTMVANIAAEGEYKFRASEVLWSFPHKASPDGNNKKLDRLQIIEDRVFNASWESRAAQQPLLNRKLKPESQELLRSENEHERIIRYQFMSVPAEAMENLLQFEFFIELKDTLSMERVSDIGSIVAEATCIDPVSREIMSTIQKKSYISPFRDQTIGAVDVSW